MRPLKKRYQNGGGIPPDHMLIKRQTSGMVPYAYEPPVTDKGILLPDPNRPELLNTGATEYKIDVGFDDGDVVIPSVVGGQLLSDDAAIDRHIETGYKYPKDTTHEYSSFYDMIGKLGLMKW